MNCPFCDYEGPSDILAGDKDVIVIEPINPVVVGHVLVIPRAHVEDFVSNPGVSGKVMRGAAMYAASHDGYACCNLITSRGEAATQTVKHLHVHLIPRFAGDGLKLPWTHG